MAGYNVFLRISCPKPTKEQLAFLGPLHATADYRGGRWLTVNLDVDAEGIIDALAKGTKLVLAGITGDMELATITATDAMVLPPGRLTRRKNN